MQAFYKVNSCDSEAGSTAMDGVVRNYYLAAEKVLWNYGPSGKDLINKKSLTEANRWEENLHTAASSLIDGNSEGHCKKFSHYLAECNLKLCCFDETQ